MRPITHIVIHCTATPAGREVTIKELDAWHRQRGFTKIGYHYVVHLDGKVSVGRPEKEVGAHVAGHNSTTIGISYVGGVDADNVNKAVDTRTPAQKAALARLVGELLSRYPDAHVLGHRDFPGVAKACPSFDVKSWWKGVTGENGRNPNAYTIRPGDTLYSISRNYKVSIADILRSNPDIDEKRLRIGTTITLP